jgi:hypothetical protein
MCLNAVNPLENRNKYPDIYFAIYSIESFARLTTERVSVYRIQGVALDRLWEVFWSVEYARVWVCQIQELCSSLREQFASQTGTNYGKSLCVSSTGRIPVCRYRKGFPTNHGNNCCLSSTDRALLLSSRAVCEANWDQLRKEL